MPPIARTKMFDAEKSQRMCYIDRVVFGFCHLSHPQMSTFAVILPAAGQSRRFHDKAYKKPFAPLGGRAVWLHSAERFMNRADVKQVIVCISAVDRELFNVKFGANIAILGVQVIEGGEHRTDSVQRALERVKEEIDFVAVHDAARPCIADPWIDDAQLVERLGKQVTIVPCSQLNIKITTRDDLKLAEQVLKVLPKPKLDAFQNPFAGDDLWR